MSDVKNTIYRVVSRDDWAQAGIEGAVPLCGSDERSGFVHLSAPGELASTASRYFTPDEEPVALKVEAQLLGEGLRWEAVESRGGALFPHLYGGRIPLGSVSAVLPIELREGEVPMIGEPRPLEGRAVEGAMELFVGDITKLHVEAVVNAANAQLSGGGGVDGAIHRAAGADDLQQACRMIGGCPTGEVRVTDGFAMPARHIIHAVGPIWKGGELGEEQLLASCYSEAVRACEAREVQSVAFPAISCGVYGFPHERAVEIALETLRAALRSTRFLRRVVLCCFSEPMANLYRARLRGPSHHQ